MEQQDQKILDTEIANLKYYYFPVYWEALVNHFGEEASKELDLAAGFEFKEVYDIGDPKECDVFWKIAAMQRGLVYNLFDIEENREAMLTAVTLEYWVKKLHDKATGAENHNEWLH